MTAVHRCPFCGALLDRDWARSHAPHCPNDRPTPARLLDEVRALHRDAAALALAFHPPTPGDAR